MEKNERLLGMIFTGVVALRSLVVFRMPFVTGVQIVGRRLVTVMLLGSPLSS